MFDRLGSIEDEFVSLEASLSDPDLVGDPLALRDVSKRYKDLTPVVDVVRRHRARLADAEAARELLVDADDSERELLRGELDDGPVGLVCATGGDLEAVPYAVDARAALGLDRCLLVLPEADAFDVHRRLGAALREPIEVWPVVA